MSYYRKSDNVHPVLVFLLLALIPISIILDGLVLRYLWGLYVVQTFDFVAISSVQAIGLMMTVRFITNQREPEKKSDYSPNVRAIIVVLEALIRPGFAALFGYIISLFL